MPKPGVEHDRIADADWKRDCVVPDGSGGDIDEVRIQEVLSNRNGLPMRPRQDLQCTLPGLRIREGNP